MKCVVCTVGVQPGLLLAPTDRPSIGLSMLFSPASTDYASALRHMSSYLNVSLLYGQKYMSLLARLVLPKIVILSCHDLHILSLLPSYFLSRLNLRTRHGCSDTICPILHHTPSSLSPTPDPCLSIPSPGRPLQLICPAHVLRQ